MGKRFVGAEEDKPDADARAKEHGGPTDRGKLRLFAIHAEWDFPVLGKGQDQQQEHQEGGQRRKDPA